MQLQWYWSDSDGIGPTLIRHMKMWTQRHEVETWKPIFWMAHDTMEGLLWCLGLGGSVVKILDCEVQPLMKKEKVKFKEI